MLFLSLGNQRLSHIINIAFPESIYTYLLFFYYLSKNYPSIFYNLSSIQYLFNIYPISIYVVSNQYLSSIYPIFIQYLSNIYLVSIQYLSNIYLVSIQYLSSIYPISIQCLIPIYLHINLSISHLSLFMISTEAPNSFK